MSEALSFPPITDEARASAALYYPDLKRQWDEYLELNMSTSCPLTDFARNMLSPDDYMLWQTWGVCTMDTSILTAIEQLMAIVLSRSATQLCDSTTEGGISDGR